MIWLVVPSFFTVASAVTFKSVAAEVMVDGTAWHCSSPKEPLLSF